MAPLNKQIPDIMDRFAFASVRLAMLALNWTWAAAGGKTPDIDRLKSTAFQLMDQAVRGYEELDEESKKYGYVAATGGFEARVDAFTKDGPRLTLLFYVDRRYGSLS